jgi:hypothetical protein
MTFRAIGQAYSASIVNHPANAYPDGMAFRDGQPQSNLDLEMTVVEYAEKTRPVRIPEPLEPRGRNLIANGDFEAGEQVGDKEMPADWQRWSTQSTAYWYGPYGRDESDAGRVIGGSINNTAIDGGFVQQIIGLSRSKRYQLIAWSASSMQTDARYLSAVGYDPTGQTSDPQAKTIVWGLTGTMQNVYEQIVFNEIRPARDAISIWTRGKNKAPGGVTFHADFDDFSLTEQPPSRR